MKTFLTTLALAGFLGCTTPSDAESAYASHYRTWSASVEAELAAGKSKIFGDREALSYLAAHAADHTTFLRRELESNMFCVLILDASPLRTPDTVTSDGLQDRQQAWLQRLK